MWDCLTGWCCSRLNSWFRVSVTQIFNSVFRLDLCRLLWPHQSCGAYGTPGGLGLIRRCSVTITLETHVHGSALCCAHGSIVIVRCVCRYHTRSCQIFESKSELHVCCVRWSRLGATFATGFITEARPRSARHPLSKRLIHSSPGAFTFPIRDKRLLYFFIWLSPSTDADHHLNVRIRPIPSKYQWCRLHELLQFTHIVVSSTTEVLCLRIYTPFRDIPTHHFIYRPSWPRICWSRCRTLWCASMIILSSVRIQYAPLQAVFG